MAGVGKRKRRAKFIISCRLQTELQALIAYACYDNDVILKAGKSAKKKTIQQKMIDLYLPSTNLNDDRI